MTSDRFHKAAKDGLLDVLKEATRKDANSKDDDSMTPVLWAAFEGRLDALRLLCGRGGDPDKCDQFGNTALHLASAKGHLHCVDFLIKFGVNMYALDIDKHSAKDLAAINSRDDILRYLDTAAANFETSERKKAKALKELAEKNCEKRMREYMKRQQRQESDYADVKPILQSGKSNNMLSTLKQKIWSSQGNLNKCNKEPVSGSGNTAPGGNVTPKFSDLVGAPGGGVGGVAGSSSVGGSMTSRVGVVQQKLKSGRQNDGSAADAGFKIGEIEADGKRTVTSLTGLQRDSEVLYVGTFSSNEDAGKRGKISDVFEVDETVNSDTEADNTCKHHIGYGTLSRSFSQPNFLDEAQDSLAEELLMQRPAGLFDRPMLGSIAFRRSVTAALSNLHPESYSPPDLSSNSTSTTIRSTTTLAKVRSNKPRSFLNISDSDDSDGGDGYSEDDQDLAGTPIQRFLAVWGLDEYLPVFQKQQIDLDTLMLLTEADLKSLGLPLGPFRKLTFAIQERRNALANPGAIHDTAL